MFRDRKYLDWLQTQHCVITWSRTSEYETVDPAHIGTAGRGLKSHDFECLPLIHHKHLAQSQGEMSQWALDLSNNHMALKEALNAWGMVHYLRYKLGAETNLEIIEKINEIIDAS